jgi:beta-galactosidase GanA
MRWYPGGRNPEEASVQVLFRLAPAALMLSLLSGVAAAAQQLPVVRMENGASQFLVQGKPFLMLGGELGNSSAGTAAQADTILPRLAKLHFNTVLTPVSWGEIEPQEGHFDFSIPDHWIDVARRQHLHLVFLWFGSWKNAMSEYAPTWVLANPQRFPRAISAQGLPLEILSALGEETARCDARAFAALLRHLKERDAAEQTVLMIQVENEIGTLGIGGRDRSSRADQLFAGAVPVQLTKYLAGHREELSPEIAGQFHPAGRTWKQMFGDDADEVFQAWFYALFVNRVAEAGKAAYGLPFYTNAQLPAPFERAGEYPSGGPYPKVQAIYRAAAPSIDFYAPDIYWPNFADWVNRYAHAGNPAFVPEARLDVAPWNALYLFGAARGFGFSPFAVDSLPEERGAAPTEPGMAEVYAMLADLQSNLLEAQAKDHVRALVLDESSPRTSQTISVGGFLFRAALSRSWPGRELAAKHGAMIVLEEQPDEFLIAGSGLTVNFLRDPDTDGQIAGIASVEQVMRRDGAWVTERNLNGDQTDQGRALQMNPKEMQVFRVTLYTYNGQDEPSAAVGRQD